MLTQADSKSSKAGARQLPEAAAFQRYTDRLVAATLLRLFPRWVRPNHLTFFRFLLTPVVLVLLQRDLRGWALGVFIAAACTDFIDGAMARTRDQITQLGTYIDPVADKLLIASVLAWVGYQYLVVQIILVFIVLELVLSAIGIGFMLRKGTARGANTLGKIKMVVQSIAILVFLISGILDLEALKSAAIYLLWLALALAVLSGGKQIFDFLAQRAERH